LPIHAFFKEIMQKNKNTFSLNLSKSGQVLRIEKMPSGILGSQFVRLGIHKGEKIKCLERLPGGTIVLQKGRQQIAVGHQLTKQITVTIVEDGVE
jgi:Fe2+ transport system protein FeoA